MSFLFVISYPLVEYTFIYKYGIDILHVGKANQFIDGGIVTDVAF